MQDLWICLQFFKCKYFSFNIGFALNHTITLTPERTFKSTWNFTPTAHICSYALELLVRTATLDLPPGNDLFKVYSSAFANAYLGKCLHLVLMYIEIHSVHK